MDAVNHLLLTLDLSPVAAGVIVAAVLLRLGLTLSLRRRRAVSRSRSYSYRKGMREELLDWLDSGLLVMLLLVGVIRPFIAQILDVGSASMAPTLRGSSTPQIDGPNDRILVTRYLLELRPARRGEIVVFEPPNEGGLGDEPMVKRLMGLPGDIVEIGSDGVLRINDQPVREPYLAEPSNLPFPRRQVPADSYFVLGDNRNDSDDSSRWGESPFVPAEHLRGKAVAICWPPDRIRLLR